MIMHPTILHFFPRRRAKDTSSPLVELSVDDILRLLTRRCSGEGELDACVVVLGETGQQLVLYRNRLSCTGDAHKQDVNIIAAVGIHKILITNGVSSWHNDRMELRALWDLELTCGGSILLHVETDSLDKLPGSC